MNLQVIANQALRHLNESMVLASLIHQDVSGETAQIGDTVGTGDLQVPLNQRLYTTFVAPTEDDLQTVVEDSLKTAMHSMARGIDQSLLSHTHEFFGQFIRMNSMKAILQAQERIENCKLIVSPWTEANLLMEYPIDSSEKFSVSCPCREAFIGSIVKWDTYMLPDVWLAQEEKTVSSFNLAINSDAMVFVSRPLEPTEDSYIGIDDNVAIRVSTAKTNTVTLSSTQEITCEILYGTAVLDKSKGCILYHEQPLARKS